MVLSYAACHHCENCLATTLRLAKILIRLILAADARMAPPLPAGRSGSVLFLASRLSASMWSPAPATRSWSTRRLISPARPAGLRYPDR